MRNAETLGNRAASATLATGPSRTALRQAKDPPFFSAEKRLLNAHSPFEIVAELLPAALLRAYAAVVTAVRDAQEFARRYSLPRSD
jgi:hypothetical protein